MNQPGHCATVHERFVKCSNHGFFEMPTPVPKPAPRLFPKQFTVRGSQVFLNICPPFVSLLVSALFCWPCSICIDSPNSLLLGVLNSFLGCVCPFCHCWCPPFSAGHAAFLFTCPPSRLQSFIQYNCLPALGCYVCLSLAVWAAVSTSALQSFTCASQHWTPVSASRLHFQLLCPAFLYICLPARAACRL